MLLDSAMLSFINFKIDTYRDSFFEGCDLICYYGGIGYSSLGYWNSQFEKLIRDETVDKKLVIFLSTDGGSVEVVEKLVDISRRYYNNVYFVIPEYAMSAGTIWAMSGNKIYMSYLSSLGPVDPQVQANDGKWVPALGYLDKFNEIIEKSKNDTISQVEIMMASQLDLANLRRYEQAVELSVELLKKWLTKYKFSDWLKTEKTNKNVTKKMKENRALEIATLLSDNKKWHSHSRFISIETLKDDIKLKIDDYTHEQNMLESTNELHRLLMSYRSKNNINSLIYVAKPLDLKNGTSHE